MHMHHFWSSIRLASSISRFTEAKLLSFLFLIELNKYGLWELISWTPLESVKSLIHACHIVDWIPVMCLMVHHGFRLWPDNPYALVRNWLVWPVVHRDDVIKWNHFSRYWRFARRIHRSPVNSPHKDQWSGALMFSLICAWINGWVNSREAGDLRRHRAHYDVTIIYRVLYGLESRTV